MQVHQSCDTNGGEGAWTMMAIKMSTGLTSTSKNPDFILKTELILLQVILQEVIQH